MAHGLPPIKDLGNLPNSFTGIRKIANIDKIAKLPYAIELAEIGIRTAVIEGLMTQARINHNNMVYDGSNNPYEIGIGIGNTNIPQYDTPENGTLASDGLTNTSGLKSALNTYVYTNLIFDKINGGVEGGGFDPFIMNDCLVKVSQQKRIITTDIQGKDNQVIEYIGMSNFVIQVSGRLTGSYKVNPKEDTKTLKEILSLGQPLGVISWWLQNLDITHIVITDFEFSQAEGEYSTQYFSFSGVSDIPTELSITQNSTSYL